MTQYQLDRAVAEATGETVCTIQRFGFQLLDVPPPQRVPHEDCPPCAACRPLDSRLSRRLRPPISRPRRCTKGTKREVRVLGNRRLIHGT